MKKKQTCMTRIFSLVMAFLMVFGTVSALPMTAAAAETGNIIDVTKYGADKTGLKDSTKAVEEAIKALKELPKDEQKTLYFPEGQYHFNAAYAPEKELYVSNTCGLNQNYKNKRIGILLEGMENVTVDGGNSLFIYHGNITAFAAIDCKNVTFTNFSFDHASPSVVDVTVVKNEGNTATFAVPACYRYKVTNSTTIHWMGEDDPRTNKPYWEGNNDLQYCQIFDTVSGRCWRDMKAFTRGMTKIEDLGNHHIKLTYGNASQVPQVGLSYELRNTDRTTPGTFIWKSENVTLKNVNAHYLHGFGMVSQMSKDITLDTVSFRVRPETGRTTASFADFVQMSSIGGKVTITNCDFSVAHDDPINIHGTFMTVQKVEGKTLTIRYAHGETAGFPQFNVGDTVDFSSKGSMIPMENSQRTIAEVKEDGWGKNTMTIVLDEAVPGLEGAANVNDPQTAKYVIENVTYTPAVEISNCRFANIPTRGILVTTRQPVVIKNNVFDTMEMASIFISCDASGWYESGRTQNVLIQNNTFNRAGSDCIFVEPTGSSDHAHQVHTNMTIENNIFNLEKDVKVVHAKSVKDLTIRNNTVNNVAPVTLTLTGSNEMAVGGTQQLNLATTGRQMNSALYRLRNCTNVNISGNRYDGGLNQSIELAEGTQQSDVTTTENLTFNTPNKTDPAGTVQYLSSDPSVLRVSASGEVTAVSEGTADVRAYSVCGSRTYESAPVTITVGGAAPQKENLKLTCDKQLLNVNETAQVTAENAENVTWSVQGEAVTVENGTITAVKPGVAVVTATTETASGSIYVTVQQTNGGLSGAWKIDRPEGNNAWQLNEDGSLTITAQSGSDWDASTRARNLFLTECEDNFTATVKLHNKTNAGWQEAGLVAFVDGNNYVAVERKHANGQKNLAVSTETAGHPAEHAKQDPTTTEEIWLKLEKNGNNFIGSYSEDGQDWTEIANVTNTALAGCKIGVIACNSSGNQNDFTFSEFKLDNTLVPFVNEVTAVTVTNAAISFEGNTAKLTYDFNGAGQDNSEIHWYLKDGNKALQKLAGETEKTLAIKPQYSGKTLQAVIVPKNSTGSYGAPVEVVSADVPTVTYPENTATLASLTMNAALTPAFAPETTTYHATVPASVTSLHVQAQPTSPDAAVAMQLDNADVTAGSSIELTAGDHTLTVVVTAKDGTTNTYTVQLHRTTSSTAALEAFSLTGLENFDANTHSYRMTVDSAVTELALHAKAAAGGTVAVRYNNKTMGTAANEQDLQLLCGAGSNVLELTVTAADGVNTSNYRFVILKQASGDAELSALTVEGAELEPVFAADVKEYTATTTADTVSITATPKNASSKVQIQADGRPVTGTVTLTKPLTEIEIRVTAEDGYTQNTYAVHVIKSSDSNADLLNLTLAGTELDLSKTEHEVVVHTTQPEFRVHAMEKQALIRVENGQQILIARGQIDDVLQLAEGSNAVTITITAPDGTTTKTITMQIQADNAVYLSNLDWVSASAGDRSWNGGQPGKDQGWEGYEIALPNSKGEKVTYTKGIGTHANSEIVYNIENQGFTTFEAVIGVSYAKFNSGDAPDLKFQVLGDGNELYVKQSITNKDAGEKISVDITNVKELKLIVTTNKGNIYSAHATWADAKLLGSQKEDIVHELTHVEAKAPTCTEAGNVEHWVCEKCGKFFADANGLQQMLEEDVVIAAGHKLEFVEKVEPTETSTGVKAHYHCTVCDKLFLDQEGKQEVSAADLVIDELDPEKPVDPDIPPYIPPVRPTEPVVKPELPFTDVSKNDWFYDSVYSAWENYLLDGMTATEFAPNSTLTVAQTIKLAAALHEREKVGKVSLTNGAEQWYSTYVSYAIANDVIDKSYADYTPAQMNAPVSRREFVKILHGALDSYTEKNTVADNAIPDVKMADQNAAEIYEFYRAGILTGSDAQGTFLPETTIKRSEAAAILVRMFDVTERQTITLS